MSLVKVGDHQLKDNIIIQGVPSSDNNFEKYYIRLMLVRNHNGFTHLPVDRVCDVHGTGDELKSHVLRISKGEHCSLSSLFWYS